MAWAASRCTDSTVIVKETPAPTNRRGKMPNISNESTASEKGSTVAVSPVDTRLESPTVSNTKVDSSSKRERWTVGPFRFRFNLANFRPGRDFIERRFSIVEAMLLLMVAYLASRGLGVIRQGIFNALFGAGPEANAYYAAFRLPDTLFNLIAGGALIQAFVHVFVT